MRTVARPSATVCTLAALMFLSACTGEIFSGKSNASCSTSVPTLRRMTGAEYNNTVRDLMGDTTLPAKGFPADTRSTATFSNDSASLDLPPALLEGYESAVATMVESMWSREQGLVAQQRLVRSCSPATGEEATCAKEILSGFARRAWRRPVAEEELAGLTGFLKTAADEGDSWEVGTQLGLEAVLLSPNFVFLNATGGNGKGGLSPYSLATRLSYFLWSSMPDDTLSALADSGKLADLTVLRAQVDRMLDDSRSDSLVQRFFGEWLNTGAISGTTPDATLFPNATPALKVAMQTEAEMFLQTFLREDQSALGVLDANYTFVNDELASYYGLPKPGSGTPVRVPLPNDTRGGLLKQAGILAITSVPTRTSVVRRGKFILGQLLCAPTPAPPPNVPALPPTLPPNSTWRQRIEAHRADPACSGCHAQMDPLGFALEHYDAAGAWRDQDNAQPIDATGSFHGKSFDGATQLALALKADPDFASCVVQKTYAFALGRSTTATDANALFSLTAKFNSGGNRMRALVESIAVSPAMTASCASN